MSSPSRADALPAGVLSLHSTVSNSSASDQSGKVTDPVQLERELAHEVLHRDLATNKPDDLLTRPTINYDEALERELEYQKKVKMPLLRDYAGPSVLHNISQEPPPKQRLLAVKRKTGCTELANGSHISSPPLPQSWYTFQQFSHQKPPLPRPINKKPSARGFSQRLQPYSQGQQDTKSLWCNLCKVPCGSPQNLLTHYQGKKHKTKWDGPLSIDMIFTSNGASQAASSGQKHEAPSTMKSA